MISPALEFQESLEWARRMVDERGIADTPNQPGNFYYNMGKLKQGRVFQEAHDTYSNWLTKEPQTAQAKTAWPKLC